MAGSNISLEGNVAGSNMSLEFAGSKNSRASSQNINRFDEDSTINTAGSSRSHMASSGVSFRE